MTRFARAARRTRMTLLPAIAALVLAVPFGAQAQRRGEYLTSEEVEAVRNAQEIDVRAAVFMKIADRRLLALTDPSAKLNEKEIRLFGPLPTGSQVDLLDDYRRTIDELMEKIDDSFALKGKTKPFVKAMEATRASAELQMKQLSALRGQLKDQEAVHFLNKAVDSIQTLAEGVAGVLQGTGTNPQK